MNIELIKTLVDTNGNYLGDNKVSVNTQGYGQIALNGSCYYIHRLVALAYGDEPIEGMHVHHIDENKLNNNIDNLMILTPSEHSTLHQKDKVVSDETKLNMSKGRKGMSFSTNHRKNLGICKSKRVIQLSKAGIEIKEYDSLLEASIDLDINHSNISKVCSGKRNTAGGFKWNYKE